MAISFGETDSDKTMSRPFGVSLLVAGVEKSEGKVRPLLFHTDPSGTYIRYDAKAIGKRFRSAYAHTQHTECIAYPYTEEFIAYAHADIDAWARKLT